MPGHDNLGAEARALLDVLSQKLGQATQPGVDSESAKEPHDATRCTGCPICLGLTYLKDHRELTAQLAQGALLIVGALRQYLDHSSAADDPPPPPASVQHIDIKPDIRPDLA